LEYKPDGIKLHVKRTFITSDLGDYALPKWASWIKVLVDGIYFPSELSGSLTLTN